MNKSELVCLSVCLLGLSVQLEQQQKCSKKNFKQVSAHLNWPKNSQIWKSSAESLSDMTNIAAICVSVENETT